jgi:hypothetical protein
MRKLSRSRSGGSGFSRRWGQHSVRIWHGLTLGRAAGRLHSSRLRMRTSHLASGHELKRPLLVGPKHTTPSSVAPPCAPLFEQACGVGRRTGVVSSRCFFLALRFSCFCRPCSFVCARVLSDSPWARAPRGRLYIITPVASRCGFSSAVRRSTVSCFFGTPPL